MMSTVISLLLLIASTTVTASLYYVKTQENASCPDQPCHTLAYYAAHSTVNFTSNATFIFLPGIHVLQQNTPIVVENVRNLKLNGSTMPSVHAELPILQSIVQQSMANVSRSCGPTPFEPPPWSSEIQCHGNTGFMFHSSRGVTIQNLVFSSCGPPAALYFEFASDLTISRVMVWNSSGYGVWGREIVGHSVISGSFFALNNYYNSSGGSISLFYGSCSPAVGTHEVISSVIESSVVVYGVGYGYGYSYGYGAGGLVLLVHCSSAVVAVKDVSIHSNTGLGGSTGNIEVQVEYTHNGSYVINVTNTCISEGKADLTGLGGMRIELLPSLILLNDSNKGGINFIIHIFNTTFVGNYAEMTAGGMGYEIHTVEGIKTNGTMIIDNCMFVNNSVAPLGYVSALSIKHVPRDRNALVTAVIIEIKNCYFLQNSPIPIDAMTSSNWVVSIQRLSETTATFSNSTFERNYGTPIDAYRTSYSLAGKLVFQENTALAGGAMSFCDESVVFFQPHTHIIFQSNHAHYVGGVFYAERRCLAQTSQCFFQLPGKNWDPIPPINLQFFNNTAGYAGSVVYGGAVYNCVLLRRVPLGPEPLTYRGVYLFNYLFKIENNESDWSRITSDPKGVCICTDAGQPDCSKTKEAREIFPGGTFVLAAVTVGQENGTTPGVVQAQILRGGGEYSSLGPDQESQTVNRTCTQLNYTILSDKQSVDLSLTAAMPNIVYGSIYDPKPRMVHVDLKPCPPGFTLSNASGTYRCGCAPLLKRDGIQCDIATQTILRPAGVWIGYHNDSTDANRSGVLFHQYCPLDYCKDTTTELQLTELCTQCTFNRTGVLCGQCQSGLSLALGTSHCLQCSHKTLALVVVFVLVGLCLVVALTIFNLTVTQGTLNGLIFYANIVHTNAATFFPHGHTNVFTVFIAWLNLDLGIQTCFYDGMDMYAKTWLQFVFLVYIWAILVLLVLISRRSVLVSMLLGTNAVKVLATLFLLSYAKLQRSIIATLSFTTLEYPDGSTINVWRYDGSVEYLHGKHIPLFLAGLAFLLLFSLPYTLILLFMQWLQPRTHYRILSWIPQLMPLTDAHTAPFTTKCRFWMGFLLLVRNAIFVALALNSPGEPTLDLLVVGLTSLSFLTLVSTFGGVYKKQWLNILELSFFLNLGVLSLATVYAVHTGSNKAPAVYISVGFAMITSVGILLYHTYHQCLEWRPLKNVLQWLRQRKAKQPERELTNEREDADSSDSDCTEVVRPPSVQVLHFDEYREPVLEILDNESR